MNIRIRVPVWAVKYKARIGIAVAAGVVAMSAVGASAAGLGALSAKGIGTSTKISAACLTGGQATVVWNGAAFVAGADPTYTVSTVTIGNYGMACRSKSYKFTIADASGTALQSFSGTVPNASTMTLTLAPALNAKTAKNVSLVIYE